MKRLLCPLLLPLLLLSTFTFADSIGFNLVVNTGGGDNFGFVQQSGKIFMGGFGGTPLGFFDSSPGYRPGDPFGGDVPIFFSGGFATIDGITYGVLWSGGLFVTPFTFPTNGKDFRVPVMVGFSANGTILDTGQLISAGGTANGYISFFVGVDGLYYPGSDFVPVPEPDTWAMLATGVATIWGVARAKKDLNVLSSLRVNRLNLATAPLLRRLGLVSYKTHFLLWVSFQGQIFCELLPSFTGRSLSSHPAQAAQTQSTGKFRLPPSKYRRAPGCVFVFLLGLLSRTVESFCAVAGNSICMPK
jgi:hypothetical protein